MNKFLLIGIVIAVLIGIVILMVYLSSNGSTTTPRTFDNKSKSLKYGNTVLVSSNKIIKTSNRTDKILYLTSLGLREYNTNTGRTVLLNPITDVKGLAYDQNSENYIVLDGNGKLFNLDENGILTLSSSGQNTYKQLYDTLTGYFFMTTDGNFSYMGGKSVKNPGDYGEIQLTVV